MNFGCTYKSFKFGNVFAIPRALGLAVLAAVSIWTPSAWGQDCNGALNLLGPGGTHAIGDTVTWTIQIGAGAISPDPGTMTISEAAFALGCQNNGPLNLCNPDTGVQTFAGNIVNVDCVDSAAAPVVISAAAPDANGVVEFTFTNPIQVNEASTCSFTFDTQIAGISADASPLVIQTAAAFGTGGVDPSSVGVCNNENTGNAGGTSAVMTGNSARLPCEMV